MVQGELRRVNPPIFHPEQNYEQLGKRAQSGLHALDKKKATLAHPQDAGARSLAESWLASLESACGMMPREKYASFLKFRSKIA